MKRGYNKAILAGNVVRDPEVRTTGTGKKVANFTIAVNNSYTVRGEKRDEVNFINCVAWDPLASIIEQWVKKGDSLLLDGRIQVRQYQTTTGENRYATEVVLDNMNMLGRRGSSKTDGDDNLYPTEFDNIDEDGIDRDSIPF